MYLSMPAFENNLETCLDVLEQSILREGVREECKRRAPKVFFTAGWKDKISVKVKKFW